MPLIDFVLSTCPPWIAMLLVAVFLRLCGHRHITFRPLLLAALLGTASTAVVVYAHQAASLLHTGLAWNWFGKLSNVLFSLAVICYLPQLDRTTVGLRWRQNPGSRRPALIAIGLLAIFAVWLSTLTTPDLRVESLLFQATMPGLDEELFMRGIILALLLQGFHDRQQAFGATIGPSVFITSAIFGAWHGFSYDQGAFHFHASVFLVTGLVGFGLAYIRQRTGSLLLPVVAHNGFNLTMFMLPALWA